MYHEFRDTKRTGWAFTYQGQELAPYAERKLVTYCRRGLSGFERAGQLVFAPGGEQGENEFRRMPAGKNAAVAAGFSLFTGVEKFLKSPPFAGGEIVQRQFIAPFRGNLPPPFVKHCQFVSAALTCCQADLHGQRQNSAPIQFRP